MIELYEAGAMNQSFDTGLIALSRFIYERKLLLHIKDGEQKPLLFSSIETEVSTVWKEMKKEREKGID